MKQANLNSILIEGTLKEKPRWDFDECGFVLVVPRMESLKDGPYPNPFEIPVSVETHPLAAGCMNHLRQGDRVRILGSLAIRSSQVAIVPEHIEYKLKEISA